MTILMRYELSWFAWKWLAWNGIALEAATGLSSILCPRN
jgi:hypothetical protein